MKTKEKDIQNPLSYDLKKIAILGIIVLAILIASSLINKQTDFLARISEFLL